MKYKRFIETVSLAVTFLVCSLALIYVVIHSGHPASWQNILCIIFAVISFLIFLFFTIALWQPKFSDYYERIFESARKRRSWSILFEIFLTGLWVAIAVGLITGFAPLFNEISGGWRIPIAIFIICWLIYVDVALAKNTNWRKIIAASRKRKLMSHANIAVIGGTGLYDIEGLTDIQEVNIDTPFGKPSAPITIGRLGEIGIAFLPRHGKGHQISPSEVPYRANVYALKSLGVEQIISVNAVGSFKQELKPGDLVIPDQIIDRTRQRINTFFGDGIVVHVPFAEPFCPVLSQILYDAAKEAKASVHFKGTYVAMEGPAFSTRAESRLYRSWGADIIGMTALPEAKLAREAEICYASVACVTDYDSWQEKDSLFTVDTILDILRKNSDTARKIIKLAVARIPEKRSCECAAALKDAIITAPRLIPPQQRKKLDLFIGKYLKGDR